MAFHLAKLPHKLLANEWLADSVPSVWYRLSDSVPLLAATLLLPTYSIKHAWAYVLRLHNGSIVWYIGNRQHRENDLPAIERVDGFKAWCQNGQLHRERDLPAIEWVNGTKEWYVNGQLHRDSNDLPAIEWASGSKEWFVNGRHHRDNDLPACEWANGSKEWWVNGVLQRRP